MAEKENNIQGAYDWYTLAAKRGYYYGTVNLRKTERTNDLYQEAVLNKAALIALEQK